MKQTKKEIEATLRNKLAKQYTEKTASLQERLNRVSSELYEERKKRLEAQRQVDELKEKVEQYEDWNRRLQEFMDMNEDERKVYLEEAKVNAELNDVFNVYRHFLGGLV